MSVTVCRVTIVKSFTYRGNPEEFSNHYAFKGAPPSEGDDASWLQLFTDVKNVEQNIYSSDVSFTHAYGYNSSDPKSHHVAQHDWTLPGPPPLGVRTKAGIRFAGDQAACVEWRMNRLNKRGKPVYLRKYVHEGETDALGGDNLLPAYLTILETYAGSSSSGIQSVHGGLRSGLDYKGVEPPNDSVTASSVIPYVTTRTLKRRGKRPRTGN